MILRQNILKQIEEGKINLAFRKWKKPTVKVNGTLLTTIGVLQIDSLSKTSIEKITNQELVDAGIKSKSELEKYFDSIREGDIYRIEFHLAGPDPRLALREKVDMSENDFDIIKKKLERMDYASNHGTWTEEVMKLISENPGKSACEIAKDLGVEKLWLKGNIRKLKTLGLTISLSVGYQISPRGKAFIEMVNKFK